MARPKLERFIWTANLVALELGVKRDTFLRAAAAAEIIPDNDGKFTSKQVFRALTDDVRHQTELQRLKLISAQAKKADIYNRVAARDLVMRSDYEQWFVAMIKVLWQTIWSMGFNQAIFANPSKR